MTSRKFKIVHGYDTEDYIEIEEDEVEKAFYCFLEKKDAIFSGGAIRGSQILGVLPDYHRAMGWNRGYKLELLDFEELKNKGIDESHTLFLSNKKDKVHYLLETSQQHLIGKNVDVVGFEPRKRLPRSGEMKHIGEL